MKFEISEGHKTLPSAEVLKIPCRDRACPYPLTLQILKLWNGRCPFRTVGVVKIPRRDRACPYPSTLRTLKYRKGKRPFPTAGVLKIPRRDRARPYPPISRAPNLLNVVRQFVPVFGHYEQVRVHFLFSKVIESKITSTW